MNILLITYLDQGEMSRSFIQYLTKNENFIIFFIWLNLTMFKKK